MTTTLGGFSFMQRYVELVLSGKTMRGIEHFPDGGSNEATPLAVILPGLDGTKCGPVRMFTELSRRLETLGVASLRYDFTGGGESDGDYEDATLTRHIAEAIAILTHAHEDRRFDSERLFLVGFSTGGYVASVVESLIEFKLCKLVLLSPVCNLPEIVHEVLSRAASSVRYVDYVGSRHTIESLRDWGQLRPTSLSLRTDVNPLVINGSRDRLVPPNVVERFCKEVYEDHCIHYVIDQADHGFRRHDQKEKVITLVTDFLTATFFTSPL